MRVIESGVTRTWFPPARVTCGVCKATMGDITIDDLEVYAYEDGMQWDTYTSYGAKITCLECGHDIKIPDVPTVIITRIRNK